MLAKKNFSKSKLASGISSGAVALTVTTSEGAKFPASGTFMAVIWGAGFSSPSDDSTAEIIRMTLNASDTFDIVRAQEGTAAKAWSTSDNIAHVLTAVSENIIQVVNTQTGAVATGTTTMPFDDTIPQNTEGDQYLTLSVTPKNTNNDLVIDVSVILSTSSSADYLAAALFKDSDAGALASTFSYVTGDHPVQLNFKHKMAAGTTSAIAFKVRAGTSGAGTTTLNGQAGVRKHGGVLSSSITITEISN